MGKTLHKRVPLKSGFSFMPSSPMQIAIAAVLMLCLTGLALHLLQ